MAESASAGAKTVLVTGATGFIGRPLCRRLAGRPEWRLRRLVRPLPGRDIDPATDLAGNLLRAEDVTRFVQAGDCLVHLACTTNPRTSVTGMARDIEDNLVPSVRLFEEFLKANPGGHVVFASTGGDMYSFDPPHVHRRESDPPMPHSGYSTHKLAAEHCLRLLCARYGGSATVLRIGNPYGEPVSEARGHGLVGIALVKALLGHELQVIEPLDSVRDYLYLEDLMLAFDRVLASAPPPGTCDVYNVGSGNGASISEIISVVESVTGRSLDWKCVVAPGQVPTWIVLDIEKFSSRFGWRPLVPLSIGVRRLWDRILRGRPG